MQKPVAPQIPQQSKVPIHGQPGALSLPELLAIEQLRVGKQLGAAPGSAPAPPLGVPVQVLVAEQIPQQSKVPTQAQPGALSLPVLSAGKQVKPEAALIDVGATITEIIGSIVIEANPIRRIISLRLKPAKGVTKLPL